MSMRRMELGEPAEVQPQTTGKSGRVVRLASARISFGELATFVWPFKTDTHLSFHTGYDVRTCRRWLSGETPNPPAEALGAVMAEMMKHFHQRD